MEALTKCCIKDLLPSTNFEVYCAYPSYLSGSLLYLQLCSSCENMVISGGKRKVRNIFLLFLQISKLTKRINSID